MGSGPGSTRSPLRAVGLHRQSPESILTARYYPGVASGSERDKPLPTIPAQNSASCRLQAECQSGSRTHGAQRWPPGRAPGRLFHAPLSDPASPQQPSVCSPRPRATRSSSAATVAGSLLGTAVPGPSPGAPGRRHALQAPKDRCLGGRPTLLRTGPAYALASHPSHAPQRQWETFQQCLMPSRPPLPTAWHRQGCLLPAVYRRGN